MSGAKVHFTVVTGSETKATETKPAGSGFALSSLGSLFKGGGAAVVSTTTIPSTTFGGKSPKRAGKKSPRKSPYNGGGRSSPRKRITSDEDFDFDPRAGKTRENSVATTFDEFISAKDKAKSPKKKTTTSSKGPILSANI